MMAPDVISGLLADQQRLHTPVAGFADWHERFDEPLQARHYKSLIPLSKPGPGEQYAFEVNLDACTGCKSCVVACHSLNGLDENESWRDVGAITGDNFQQTVTTACHHCADPACANGCPTLAYEKDATTGIVRHLDDQCIGCSYCTMKCPYDAPKFNLKRGIVRKCDMCHGRLTVGEAPACVQACPNGAISIRIVRRERVAGAGMRMLPGAFESDYTRPMTRYVSGREAPRDAVAADASRLREEDAHHPLAVMLVLTQAAAGGMAAANFVTQAAMLLWVSAALLCAGVAAGVLHLGQPLKAWKSFLGWRTSWLSREIIAFGLALGLSGAACCFLLPAWPAAVAALGAVACSAMVYADTRRGGWRARLVFPSFFSSVAVSGVGLAACWEPGAAPAAASLLLVKLLLEIVAMRSAGYSARLVRARLGGLIWSRLAAGLTGAAGLFIWPSLGVVGLLLSELLERSLFFRAVKVNRMPGL